MKINKKLLSFCLFMAMMTINSGAYAQNNAKTILNNFIQNWLGPIFVFFLLAGFLVGVVRNFEDITNKHDDGSTLRGFKNVGVLMLYVFIVGAVASAMIVGANELLDRFVIQ